MHCDHKGKNKLYAFLMFAYFIVFICNACLFCAQFMALFIECSLFSCVDIALLTHNLLLQLILFIMYRAFYSCGVLSKKISHCF